jgi:hypothetical protein
VARICFTERKGFTPNLVQRGLHCEDLKLEKEEEGEGGGGELYIYVAQSGDIAWALGPVSGPQSGP